MKIRVGLLGLPNVGKSSLFNALVVQEQKVMAAQVANYPFCTIDPNRAMVSLPDEPPYQYLQDLGRQTNSANIVPAMLEWIDVAGLAPNAHLGEGLGNQFLGTLRECHAICHVVRTFTDPSTTHVNGDVDPSSDIDLIHLELLLSDLAHVERRIERKVLSRKTQTTGINHDDIEMMALDKVLQGLREGIPARSTKLSSEEELSLKSLGLLTLKPMFYSFNVDEVDYTLGRDQASKEAQQIVDRVEYFEDNPWTLVSAKLDTELSLLTYQEQANYWSSVMVDSHSQIYTPCHEVLPLLVRKLLHLAVAYTGPGVPPERSRTTKAHLFATKDTPTTISNNNSFCIYDLAGRIHDDIQKGFIRAEVVSAAELLQHSNYVAARELGYVRTEGKDYRIQPNDVILIKWK